MKKTEFSEALEDTPIIPAVVSDETLEISLKNDSRLVFILYGDICNIEDIVSKVKAAGKLAFVHMDLIAGLGSREVSVEYIKTKTSADGIITTKPLLAKKARELGLYSVLRFFVLDSMALKNLEKQANDAKSDCIEILPGVMPKIIKRIVGNIKPPIIAGGLISDKEDVMNALDAGAVSVSSTNTRLWEL